jgi:hypothetical protein
LHWSVTLREESALSVLEKRVLKRIFGYMLKEVTGEWRDDKELHDL